MARVMQSALELPAMLREWIQPDDELMVFVQGDTLILKKMHLPCLFELAGRAPQDEERPMQEIVDEVHHLLDLKQHGTIRLITPREFMELESDLWQTQAEGQS